MSQPTTIEEAAKRQLALYERMDAGEHIPNLRTAQLKEGYEFKPMPDYGTGYYPVNIETQEVCEWNGKWMCDGKVLLCQDCFLDGT